MRPSNSVPALRRQVFRRMTAALALLLAAASASPAFAEIEAIKGKVYKLSEKHGPWMIMVTSLGGETSDMKKNAEEAADQIVYQLRKKGIPAYFYRIEDEYDTTESIDRQKRYIKGKYKAQQGMIGIVAGNYKSYDAWDAQQTLKFIKKFAPKVKVAGPGKESREVALQPLAKAFLTRNPLLPPEDQSRKLKDPLLLTLNSRHPYSLLENKGKYSLVVSTFNGNSQIKPANFDAFDKRQQSHMNISLENAARESELLCATMRKQGLEAYVFHERYRSVVTVGAFKSKDDPEVARLTKLYQAKWKRDERTGQEVYVAEAIKIPNPSNKNQHLNAWTMDPNPTVMEVPR